MGCRVVLIFIRLRTVASTETFRMCFGLIRVIVLWSVLSMLVVTVLGLRMR